MASKFAQFIVDNKIDPRRIAAASKKLESLQPEDRAKRLARRNAKKSETKPAEGAEKPTKPRSGRPATSRALAAASAGKPVSGPTKTRLLRAVNYLLEQKKKSATDLKSLF
ncbi:MAG: hypothetical protein EOO73_00160 [Myxococcales bacterium]|nr:MAG: hypothetical protein EOO73_00160 [Myxococcales bacterium]